MKSQRSSLSPAVWAGMVFFVALLFQLVGMTRAITVYDESIELFGAVRVLHGDVPYRDFWTEYGPAQFYMIAGLFKMFGASVLVARLYHAFAGACVITLLFLLMRRMTGLFIALCFGSCALLWAAGVNGLTYEFPTYPALALTLASIFFLFPLLNDELKPWATVLSGVSVGLVTLFRHDFGFYVFISELAMIAGRATPMDRDGAELCRIPAEKMKDIGSYVLGLSIVLIPSAIVLFKHVPLHDLYFELIYYPARIYPATRSLPFPRLGFLLSSLKAHDWVSLEGQIDYFPGWVCLTSVVYILATRRTWKRETGDAFRRRLHVLLTILLVLMTVKGLVRVSPVQLIQAILLALAMLAILVDRVSLKQKGMLLLLTCCFLASALPTALVALSFTRVTIANTRNTFAKQADTYPGAPGGLLKDACEVPSGLERMRCFYLEPYEVQAIQYIQAHTNPTDTIYVGAGRHDKLWVSDIAFYFVSQRMAATKWHQLDPGVQTTQAIQMEMIADLKRSRPPYVALEIIADDKQEPNQSRFSSGVRLLDDYIHQNYSPVASFGPTSILCLNSSGAIPSTI